MDRQGYIKLTDFGLAKIDKEESIDIKGMKEDGNYICGTLEYVAPEVISKKEYGPHTDIWSFGILVYEMLTGKVFIFFNLYHNKGPFNDKNKKLLFEKILRQ